MKVSKSILILFVIFYLLDSFTGGQISPILELDVNKIINDFELWRLFSYPFATGSFESSLLFVIAIGLFGPKIEERYNPYIFPLLFFLISLIHGTTFTWIYIYTAKTFAGTEGLSFFIFFAFINTNSKAKFKFTNKGIRVQASLLISLIISLWLGIQIIKVLDYKIMSSLDSLIFAGLGIGNSIILWLQFYLFRKKQERQAIDTLDILENDSNFADEELSQFEKDELSLALIASQQRIYKEHQKDENLVISPDPLLNEERMNSLLDKISDKGYTSLSTTEQKFLKEYSKSL
ncbi:rhomboid family intramembrane serine protease [Candidatus Kapabacteria bacterium]|nr:rhomboid family intramembrane serine protease [Candidatus Kapabacteria bacterium]